MKKFLLFMLGALMALPGFARDFEYWYKDQILTYTVLDEDAKTCETKAGTSGNPVSGKLVIPAVAKDGDIEYSVTTIGDHAFSYRSGLTSVDIPNSVTTIGDWAFFDCSGLTSVDIPNSVTTIGSNAFNYCSGLTSVDIPNSVTYIGNSAFSACRKLKDFIVKDGETTVNFEGRALTGAPIENLYMGRNWTYSTSMPNSIKTLTIGDKVTELPGFAFSGCYGLTAVDIPNSVTSIGWGAFSECSGLTSMDIPNSVTTIGDRAFSGCSGLTSVTIGNSVTTIGSDAFSGCYGLTAVDIPNSVTTIGSDAFYNCYRLTSMDIPNSVTTIGDRAFSGCSGLTSVAIGNSVTTIGYGAFDDCNGLIKSAYPDNLDNPFHSGVVAIGYPANGAIIEDGFVYGPDKETIYFAPLSLEGEYIVPEYVTAIGENAFSRCRGLTSVTVSTTTPSVMADNSFSGLYTTTVLNVPENAAGNYLATNWSLFDNLRAGDLTTETYATGNLKYRLIPAMTTDGKNLAVVIPGDYSSLTEVTIPERFTVSENGTNTRYYVDGIGYKAFNGCSNLATVTFNSRNASKMIGDYAFAETKIYAIIIPETVEAIGKHAFDNCTSITELTIPGSVRTIGDYAFYNTSNLKTVVLNEGLETIGAYAFCQSSDRNVSSIYIPSTVKSIGNNAFNDFTCSRVNISDLKAWCGIDFANFMANPLYNSHKLYLNDQPVTTLVIPEGIAEVKPYAFYGCPALESVTFSVGLQSIGNEAFYECSALESVTFNEELQSIDNNAFNGCSALKSVTFNEGLQSIGEKAFYNVGTLGTITIPGTVTYIGTEAFNAKNPILTFEYGDSPVELAVNSFKAPTSLSWDRPVESLNIALYSLENLAIGNSVTEIPAAKFKGISSLASLTLGSRLKTIGDKAFSGCRALTEVIVPPSVESIGASAFSGNTRLTSIIMGHNVKSIGENAFYECPAQTVSITAQTPPTAYDNTFSNYTGKLYVQGQKAADLYYDADYCWYQFEGHVMIEPTELKVDGEKTLNGKPGDTFQLTATLYPEDVTLPQIFYYSTNPEIATVDANGLVTLHADMSDVMTAAEGDDTSAPCKIIAESLYADGPMAEWTVNSDAGSGIDNVINNGNTTGDIDFNAPVEVYNLQGVMVGRSMDNLATGIYIVRQNNLVKKIAVK